MTEIIIDRKSFASKTRYIAKKAAYEYRPRGFYEAEYPDLPYPEVVDFAENPDGTITLTVHAVYPDENTSRAYSHKTVIRPLNNEEFQYVSNEMISSEDDMDIWWHCDRLTEINSQVDNNTTSESLPYRVKDRKCQFHLKKA